jgi:hypothetical protein
MLVTGPAAADLTRLRQRRPDKVDVLIWNDCLIPISELFTAKGNGKRADISSSDNMDVETFAQVEYRSEINVAAYKNFKILASAGKVMVSLLGY